MCRCWAQIKLPALGTSEALSAAARSLVARAEQQAVGVSFTCERDADEGGADDKKVEPGFYSFFILN